MKQKQTLIQLLALCVLGFVIFLYQLGYPAQLIFDETYHIPAAQKYLNGVFFQENHPPLGKLLIALGEKIWQRNKLTNQFVLMEKVKGDIPQVDFFGYRFFPALFGLLSIIVLFFIFRLIIPDQLVAFVFSLMALFDNALIVQARSAMLDSFLIFFLLLTTYLSLKATQAPRLSRKQLLLLGFASAGAVLVKHTGWIVLVILLPVILRVIRDRKTDGYRCFIFFIFAFSLTYVLVWKIHYSLGKVTPEINSGISQELMAWKGGGRRIDPIKLTYLQIRDAWAFSSQYNRGVPDLDLCKPDEVGSPWYYWPFGGRGISYRWETSGDWYRHLFLIGNPLVWLISLSGVLLPMAWIVGGWFFGIKVRSKSSRLIPYFALIYISYMMPFLLIRRVMYLYHYLPAMVFGLILFSLTLLESRRIGKIGFTEKNRRYIALALIGLVFFSFIIYAPLTYYLPVSKEYMKRINILPIWNTDFQQRN
ncbi:hypothetical protein A3D09_01880 [Candidatus Collierbacteria bacterium RIFCSPHIGHO2_02_FULL_49_10]|uniref:Polyprenol-phosphate-mannose--protein mannosyltransferase n=1 Tax=Candidatus Collierbacteria bacterium RIFCSPHIGHO2_02_FULL_49_10 TaxID=1817723 RepID=A0A1F5EY74_9BACT|nr:MAG: hypothetical protein A3D09_01880 [Candidatus Collierbacteria bacterium RIFCSPHIGHO2_02_FULL_49_10]